MAYMLGRARARLFFVLALTCPTLTGCAGNSVFIDSVGRGSDGRLWVAGTRGVAGYFDPDGFHRANYRQRLGAGRSAYGTGWGSPAAHVLIHAGVPYLFTRPGDVMRREGNRWRRLRGALPRPSSRYEGVIYAVNTQDGRILLYITPRRLLWTTIQDLENGQFQEEQTTAVFSYLKLLSSNELYGLEQGGQVFRRRDGPGSWSVVAHLPPRNQTNSVRGLAELADGTVAVAAERGLLLPADGQTELVSTDELLRRAGVDVPPGEEQANWIIRVVPVENEGDLLWIRGRNPGLLGGAGGQEVFWNCPDSVVPAGGFRGSSSLFIVGHEGELCELVGSRCVQIHEQELNR